MPQSVHSHELNPVGFWPRALALLTDSVLEFVYITILIALAGATPDPATGISPNPPVAFIIEYVLPLLVTVLLWARWQTTPGKLMIHARIVDARTGGVPSTGQFVIRYLAYLVSALPLGLGFFWVMWDRRKQGWHDKLAKTLVVRSAPANAPAAVPAPVLPLPRTSAPPVRLVSAGPWANTRAPEGQASLVWFNLGSVHMAEVAAGDLAGATSAVASGASFPARAVPLGTLHRASGEWHSGELTIRYGDDAGQAQEVIASFQSQHHRAEFLEALHARLGPAWACAVERGSRWKPAADLVCAALLIGLVTLGLMAVAEQIAAGTPPEVRGETGKETLLLAFAYVLAGLLGSDVVGAIGGTVVVLCLVALPFVLLSPPRHVVLRRDGWDSATTGGVSFAAG